MRVWCGVARGADASFDPLARGRAQERLAKGAERRHTMFDEQVCAGSPLARLAGRDISALGCAVGTDFDVEKLRYNRIIIMHCI